MPHITFAQECAAKWYARTHGRGTTDSSKKMAQVFAAHWSATARKAMGLEV